MTKSRKYLKRGRSARRRTRSRKYSGGGPTTRSRTVKTTASATAASPRGYKIIYKSVYKQGPKETIDIGTFSTEKDAVQAVFGFLQNRGQMLIYDMLEDQGVRDAYEEGNRMMKNVKTYRQLIDLLEHYSNSYFKDTTERDGWDIVMKKTR